MNNSDDVGEVIYQKGEADSEQDEIWDDTELIQAYDKAVNLAYDAAHASIQATGGFSEQSVTMDSFRKPKLDTVSTKELQNSKSKKSKSRSKRKGKKDQWNVGDLAMAKFSEDGLYYECNIVSLDRNRDKCVVCFCDYENEEEKAIGSLRRLSEWNSNNDISESGEESQSTVDMSSGAESNSAKKPMTHYRNFLNMANGTSDITGSTAVPLMPPPIPPGLLRSSGGAPGEDEAMASMLMSWYMNGYHTGYYQAMKDSKKKLNKIP